MTLGYYLKLLMFNVGLHHQDQSVSVIKADTALDYTPDMTDR